MQGTQKVFLNDGTYINLLHQVAMYEVDGVEYIPPPYVYWPPDFNKGICRKEWDAEENKAVCQSVYTL
jgi:hypothetical protein